MIPFLAQEFSFRAMSDSEPELSNRKTTQTFTAYAGTLDIPESSIGSRNHPFYENLNIDRQEITYDAVYLKEAQQLVLRPRPINIVSPVSTTINTFFVIDNGSTDTGSTVLRNVPATFAGTLVTLGGDGATQLYRRNHFFVEPSDILNNFGRSLTDDVGSANLNNALSESPLTNAGRYVLATYKFNTFINVPANTPITIQLGNIIFQF